MKISLLQTDIRWNAPEDNRAHILDMIYAAPYVEMFVLPETFTTGFDTGGENRRERDGVQTLEWMKALAKGKGAAIAGSIGVEEAGMMFNRMYFVSPDGSYSQYDKKHLFTFAGEDKYYTPGGDRVIVEYNGWRILLQICYDLRFPVFARNRGDYDIILYVANWPQSRISAWNTLLKARAIENLCYVAGVNRVGNDPYNQYSGDSAIIDFKGIAMSSAPEGDESIVTAELSLDALAAFREKFPAHQDADDFTLL